MNRKGISRDDTVVIYGDKSNWWAAYALWVFSLFGHPDVRLLNGGRMKWMADGREMTTDIPKREGTDYPAWGCRRSEEHTSELQSRFDLVCRLLLEKKKKKK